MAVRHKITFRLEQDEDGYPPVQYESVWAKHIQEDEYELDSIPFFTRDATLGDRIKVTKTGSELMFDRVVSISPYSLVRVVYCEGANPKEIREALEKLGCSTEWDHNHALISVNVPDGQKLRNVQKYLTSAADQGILDYEEAILKD